MATHYNQLVVNEATCLACGHTRRQCNCLTANKPVPTPSPTLNITQLAEQFKMFLGDNAYDAALQSELLPDPAIAYREMIHNIAKQGDEQRTSTTDNANPDEMLIEPVYNWKEMAKRR